MIRYLPEGRLAREFGYKLELKALKSNSGYYLGTEDEEGPVSRESEEYWKTKEEAKLALDTGVFIQRWEV